LTIFSSEAQTLELWSNFLGFLLAHDELLVGELLAHGGLDSVFDILHGDLVLFQFL
jgi:hypothetical protein